MRGLPAQFTDIAVSLSSGQQPLTVLLQQGGQLKDMFGGIGPAARGMAQYVAGMVNPFTLGAAAVAALGFAYYKGSEEADAFNLALANTNGAIGLSSNQLADMASRMSAVGGTTAAAAEALAALTASGVNNSADLERMATVAGDAYKYLGVSVEETAKAFAALEKEPLQAALKLDESHRFLTASVYDQIKALEAQGNATEAARVAQDAFAAATAEKSSEVRKNLGDIERAWDAITGKIKQAGDAMLAVGRQQTLAQQLADKQAALLKVEAGDNGPQGGRFGKPSAGALELRRQIDALQSDMRRAATDAQRDADREASRKADIRLRSQSDEWAKANRSREKQQSDELAQQKRFLDAKVITEAEYNQRVAAIRDKYKDKSASGSARKAESQFNQFESMRDQLQRQLIALSDSPDKTEQSWVEKLNNKRFDYLGKTHRQELITLARAVDDAKLAQDKAEALAKYRERAEQVLADMGSQRSADQQSYARELGVAGMGDKARAEIERINQIGDKAEEIKRKLNDDVKLKFITEDEKAAQIAQIDAITRAMIEDAQKAARAMDDANANWSNGASRAWENYADSAANMASQVEGAMGSAFSSMEDALTDFVMTGKLSFADFAKSVLADIARIQMRQAIVGIGTGLYNSGFGGLFGPSVIGSAKGNAFSGGEVVPFAKGGAFTNTIASQPTLAPMALFGEAGPEAIMPLGRDAQGRLGVRGSGASNTMVNMSFVIEGEQAAGTPDPARLAKAVEATVRQVIASERRNGGILRN